MCDIRFPAFTPVDILHHIASAPSEEAITTFTSTLAPSLVSYCCQAAALPPPAPPPAPPDMTHRLVWPPGPPPAAPCPPASSHKHSPGPCQQPLAPFPAANATCGCQPPQVCPSAQRSPDEYAYPSQTRGRKAVGGYARVQYEHLAGDAGQHACGPALGVLCHCARCH